MLCVGLKLDTLVAEVRCGGSEHGLIEGSENQRHVTGMLNRDMLVRRAQLAGM
jgi:hypothetical protein